MVTVEGIANRQNYVKASKPQALGIYYSKAHHRYIYIYIYIYIYNKLSLSGKANRISTLVRI